MSDPTLSDIDFKNKLAWVGTTLKSSNLGTVSQFLFREFLIWTFLYAIISTSYRLYVGFINSLSPDDPNRNSYVKAG